MAIPNTSIFVKWHHLLGRVVARNCYRSFDDMYLYGQSVLCGLVYATNEVTQRMIHVENVCRSFETIVRAANLDG
jgi:hypothetical protein